MQGLGSPKCQVQRNRSTKQGITGEQHELEPDKSRPGPCISKQGPPQENKRAARHERLPDDSKKEPLEGKRRPPKGSDQATQRKGSLRAQFPLEVPGDRSKAAEL